VDHFQQQGDIVEMQAGGRFIENIQRAAGIRFDNSSDSLTRCASPPDKEADIAEADIQQRLQFAVDDAQYRAEEFMRIFHGHFHT
jgi:hypothetical protein